MAAGRRTTLVLDEPRHPELEAALVDGDSGAWRMFGAWLTTQGSMRGEAIAREAAVPAAERADDPVLKNVYRAVQRASAAAQLAREQSWRFGWSHGFPRRAEFMLSSTRRRGPRAHVEERWQNGRVDPEQVEAERRSLEHGLGLHELRLCERLALAISEFPTHLPLVARMLAARRWDHLEHLVLGVAHYEPVWMHADASADVAIVGASETEAMLAALPRLRRLELTGHFIFPKLEHPTLRELRLTGHLPVLDGAFVDGHRVRDNRGLALPKLRRLELAAMNPSSGAGPPMDACQLRLDPERLPALLHLELQDSDLGDETERGGVFETIARSPILPQLKTLRVAAFDIPDDDPEPTLRKLAPCFAHLERLTVDDATPDELRPFERFGNTVLGPRKPPS